MSVVLQIIFYAVIAGVIAYAISAAIDHSKEKREALNKIAKAQEKMAEEMKHKNSTPE